jgi:hypothetical protein
MRWCVLLGGLAVVGVRALCDAEVIGALPRQQLSDSDVREAVQKLLDSQPAGHKPIGAVPCGAPLNVKSSVALKVVNDLDDSTGGITFTGWFRIMWLEPALLFEFDETEKTVSGRKWDSDASYLPVEDTDSVWKPDLDIENARDFHDTEIVDKGMYLYDAKFAVKNGYNVYWSRPGTWTVTCGRTNPPEPFRETLKRFPFDATTCKMDIASWLYDSSYIQVDPDDATAATTAREVSYVENTAVEFMITKPQPALADSGAYESVQSSWSVLTLEFKVQRNPHFIVYNAVLPMVVVVGLSVLAFWLPIIPEHAGSGERIGYCVTLLLTILATSLFTAESRPKTSVETWLDRFQACCIFLTVLPIVETIMVFRFFNQIKGVIEFWQAILESEARKTQESHDELNEEEHAEVNVLLDSMHDLLEARRRERKFTHWMVDFFKFKGQKTYRICCRTWTTSVVSTVFQLFFKDGVVGPREVDDIFKHVYLLTALVWLTRLFAEVDMSSLITMDVADGGVTFSEFDLFVTGGFAPALLSLGILCTLFYVTVKAFYVTMKRAILRACGKTDQASADQLMMKEALQTSRTTLLDEGKLSPHQTLPLDYARAALKDLKLRKGHMSVLEQIEVRSTAAFRNWTVGEEQALSPKAAVDGEKDLEASQIQRRSKDMPDKAPDLSAAIASLENAVKQLTQKIVERPRQIDV